MFSGLRRHACDPLRAIVSLDRCRVCVRDTALTVRLSESSPVPYVVHYVPITIQKILIL